MSMYGSAIRSQSLGYLCGRTETRRERQVNTLTNFGAGRCVRARCKRVKILLNVPSHCWVSSGQRSVKVASRAQDPVEFLIKLDGRSKKTPISVGPVRTCVREIDCLRFPTLAE